MQLRKGKKFQTLHATRYTLHGRGFTLVETLVAITVLLVSIAGPLTIATKGLSASLYARDQITAFYLAQEAVEFVRANRDEHALIGTSWSGGFLSDFSSCIDGGVCTIDIRDGDIASCPSGNCPRLLYDNQFSLYSYVEGAPSKFTRSVAFRTVNDNEMAVSVTMQWMSGLLPRSFTIQEHIFDWQSGVVTAAQTDDLIYNATGGLQSLLVPPGVTEITAKIWGAGGGGVNISNRNGASGGYTEVSISVSPGETLNIVVGEGGGPGTNSSGLVGAGAGGGSAILRNLTPLAVAGGGGGAGGCTSGNNTGVGGGEDGGDGNGNGVTGATGGSQTSGGQSGGSGNQDGTDGSGPNGGAGGGANVGAAGGYGHGFGGDGGRNTTDGQGGGGGGGGYFGGGGGDGHTSACSNQGGGGSGYADGPGVSGATSAGNPNGNPANTGDPAYQTGIGVGGAGSSVGGDGLIVITF